MLCLCVGICEVFGTEKSEAKKVINVSTTKLTFHPVPSPEEVAELAGPMNGKLEKGVPEAKEIVARAEEPL